MGNMTTVASESLSVDLDALLKTEIRLSEALLALISEEKKLLEQPLSAEMDTTLQHKIQLLHELQQTSKQRQDLMLSHGYDSSPQGVEFCTLACAHAPDIRQSFSRLADLARECHNANQLLGQLLNRKSGFFARLLGNLSDNDQPPLYQANGLRDAAVVNLRSRLSV